MSVADSSDTVDFRRARKPRRSNRPTRDVIATEVDGARIAADGPPSARRGPVLRKQVVEAGCGVRADTSEDVGQVGERIFVVSHAGGDEGVQAGEILASLFVPDEEEILSSEGDDSQRRLASVVVRRDWA